MLYVFQQAEKAAYEAMQVDAELQAAVNLADASSNGPTKAQEDVAMSVDTEVPQGGESSGKRKHEDEGQAEGSKKARVGKLMMLYFALCSTHSWSEPKPPLKRYVYIYILMGRELT